MPSIGKFLRLFLFSFLVLVTFSSFVFANHIHVYCGDRHVNQPSEQCDDGNKQNGDGCSSVCTIEHSCDYGCFSPDSLDDNSTEHIGHSNETTLQNFLDSKGYDFNVVRDQTNTQVWHNQNNVELQIKFLGKFAAQQHVFGYYLNGDANSFVPLFEDANHPSYNLPIAQPGDTFTVNIPAGGTIGFAIDSWKNGRNFFYTENSKNPNSTDHVLVFDSCGEFVLAFEDKFTDFDFQDIVVSVKKISCSPAPVCGDGIINQPTEQCDGTAGVPDHYTCTQQCTLEYAPYCGDGTVNQHSEQCDGNAGVPEHYLCTDSCTLQYVPYCGDGKINQPAETCDGQEGVPEHYICTDQCALQYIPFCGDNVVNQSSEDCDGSDHVPEHYLCTAECKLEYVPYCGDGQVNQQSETCDDGNNANGDGCSSSCQIEPQPFCGNGIKDGAEECDGTDGVPEHYACTADCRLEQLPFCGDGVKNDAKEECDGTDGVPDHYTCTAQCALEYVPYCGDKIVNQTSEVCDGIAGVPEHYFCTESCSLEYIPYCGDNIVNQGTEQCDDGNFVNGDGCNAFCQVEFCGNGIKEGTEECDGTDGVTPNHVCTDQCTLQYVPFCGDGIKNQDTESCDGTDGVPDHYACTQTCSLEYIPYCGDEIINQQSEQCDGVAGTPDHYYCTENCTLEYVPYCGDKIVNQPTETCDGQNGVPKHYFCTDNCSLEYAPYCGDGIINQQNEQCDGSAGVPDHYACTQECALQYLPYCGDGAINQPGEQCDDGNNVDGDSCSALCTLECVPPVTTKTYGEPFYSDSNSEWVNSLTEIQFDAQLQEPFCGDGKPLTYYRVTLVDDSFCRDREACLAAWGSGSWNLYGGPVSIAEQSCHLIEFYSTDSNGNAEAKKQQCAFVDNSGPVAIKTVGEPSDKWTPGKNGQPDSIFYPQIKDLCWNGQENGIDCWKVTLLTPITMSCTDPQPHPVGHETISFQAQLDGDNATARYCDLYKGNFDEETSWCTIAKNELQFFFVEETEHNLKYFCTDALGNKGPVDDEKFKVEGTKFEIHLNKKWNLISVPFSLINGSPSEVFKGVKENLDAAWYYDAFADQWFIYRPTHPEASNLDSIEPGNGYWVSMLDGNVLTIGGSLFLPAQTPPSKPIKKGWNMIGYFGADGQNGYNGPAGNGKLASCELISLNSLFEGKGWTTLSTYWEPNNPDPWHYLSESNRMDPGAGYWLNASKDNEFSYSTVCG